MLSETSEGERVCAVCLCKSQAKIVFKDREREGEHHIRIKNKVEVSGFGASHGLDCGC